MKRTLTILLIVMSLGFIQDLEAQCSICTKTAQQLGHKPAKELNNGIIYLMIAPLAIIGFVGYRWYKGGGMEPGHDHSNETHETHS
jgi:hypothetical protein